MIDPDIRRFVEASERFFPPDAAGLPLAEQRKQYDSYARTFAVRRPEGVVSQDAVLQTPSGPVPLRLYRPATPAGGLILYAHGGGFILGSLESHDGIVARVAAQTGAAVVAIDYRLAPEHPAPAALEDVLAVVASARAGTLPWADAPTTPLALMGDSAGATLVASAALQVGQASPGALAALALVYPVLGQEPAEPARTSEAHAPMLTLADVHFYRDIYGGGRPLPPGSFVLDAPDLSALPPAVLLPAEHDPLRDDCTELARRLRAHGTPVLALPGTGLVHGCLRALDRAAVVQEPFAALCDFLAGRLRPGA